MLKLEHFVDELLQAVTEPNQLVHHMRRRPPFLCGCEGFYFVHKNGRVLLFISVQAAFGSVEGFDVESSGTFLQLKWVVFYFAAVVVVADPADKDLVGLDRMLQCSETAAH